MVLNSHIRVIPVLFLAAALSLTSALAEEDADTQASATQEQDATEAPSTEGETAQTEVARRSNSCDGYNRESAGWTLNVAYDNDPRHTPCVTDRSTRIRPRSDDNE